MIDLHSHILPGIDDGAPNLSIAIAMARASVANGVQTLACTPHIFPGVWPNTGPQIRTAVEKLQCILNEEGIPLHLVTGSDAHITPDMVGELRSGNILSLHDSRYVLIEAPHHVAPPRFEDVCYSLLSGGYVPILTHPERLSWIRSHYEMINRLARSGVWMQITAGSLTGGFGPRAKQWGEKMLADGIVHILASDTHNTSHRAPVLAEGWEIACRVVGEQEAFHLVVTRPYGILCDKAPEDLPSPALSKINMVKNYEPDLSAGPGSAYQEHLRSEAGDHSRGMPLVGKLRRFFGRPAQ